MILTCPACTTRYFVEDSRLGPDGRTVRCASCGASWHAEADEPLELTSFGEEGAVAREALAFKPDEPAAIPAPELPKAFRAKVQQQRRVREAATAGVVWAGMVSALAAVLVGAYVFRVDVVRLYPKAAGAYAFARVPVNPTGLEIEKVRAVPAPGGVMAVSVSGEIRNVEDEASAPPPLRVTLVDKAGHKVSSRIVHVAATPLKPGKALSFSAILPDPRATADDVAVEFALDLVKPKSKAEPKPSTEAKGHGGAPTKSRAADDHAVSAHPPAAPALRPQVAAGSTPHSTPTPATAHGGPAHPAPAKAAPAKAAQLRPSLAPGPRPVEARPLASSDPYALDMGASQAVSAKPHG